MNQEKRKIVYESVEQLKPNPRKPRTHSKRQQRQIADKIKSFGFTNPILVDKNNVITAGHGRLAALKMLGMSQAPTIRLVGREDQDFGACEK